MSCKNRSAASGRRTWGVPRRAAGVVVEADLARESVVELLAELTALSLTRTGRAGDCVPRAKFCGVDVDAAADDLLSRLDQ
jgi:hypothetical protein